jgi:hypothetical protein
LRYDYGPNRWTGLTSWTSTVMSASPGNALYATLNGHGTWELSNGSWQQLASHDAYNLAAVDSGMAYASFGGNRTGTWEWINGNPNGGWNQITAAVPIAMDASTGGTLYASYSGDGTYSYSDYEGWVQITSDVANAITVVSDDEMIGSFADGTYECNQINQNYKITSEVATQLGHSGSTVIGSWSSGIYTYEYYTTDWQYVGTQSYQVA